jgi:hypothetical protein
MSLAGAVVWAVAPFVPQAPFRIYAGEERPPFKIPQVVPLIHAGRSGGDNQFDFIVPGKSRPVLILADKRTQDLGEYLALRLLRFSKLSQQEQEDVRAQRHESLFYLKPERFSLPEENAAMLSGLLRVHVSAVDPSPCGRLDAYELRTVQERFLRFYSFDLRALLQIAAEQMARKNPGGPDR